tara:strand:+ start:5096 stop:5872 length:777 start_codon:yes stop_codon:yes gene_type:complete
MLDSNTLLDLAEANRESFRSAEPFPHVVIDNFLPLDLAEEIHDLFPSFEEADPRTYQREENKIATRPDVPTCPERLRQIMYALNSHEIITPLEVMTGINGLLPDPHFFGAGLQQTGPGGKLGIHVDFNKHKHLRLDRRLNLLIYFNKDWKEEWGGHFELWDKDMTACQKKILPIFNRMVVFATTDESYHGLPDPIQCPEGESRKSLILFFYSNGREDGAAEVGWTQHQKRPNAHDYKFVEKGPFRRSINKVGLMLSNI